MKQTAAERIDALDDARALALLATIAEAHMNEIAVDAGTDTDFPRALSCEVGAAEAGEALPDDAAAARAALHLLAEDDRLAPHLAALLDGPSPQRMDLGVVGGTLLASGIILALQTHFRFQRSADGRWSIRIEKKPTDRELIAPLLRKLISLMS